MQRNADLGSILILILILIIIRIGTKIGSRRPHILGQIAQLSIIIFLFATITGTCQRISKSNLRIKPNYVHLITKPKIRLPPKFKSILSHLWLCDLISRSGDVHPNPGPRQAGPLWAAVFTFNPYLLISINELLISIIHLLISIIHLLISKIHLLISIIHLLISIIHLLISIIHLLISINMATSALFLDINK